MSDLTEKDSFGLNSSNVNKVTTSELLIVIVDASPAQKYLRDEPKALIRVVEALIVFSNTHLLLDSGNQVAFYVSTITNSYMIYPSEKKTDENVHIRQVDGQYEEFLGLESIVRKSFKAIVNDKNFLPKNVSDEEGLSTCLASTLLQALSYINRKEKSLAQDEELISRILIVSGSSESTAQYMAFNNAFFAAQKLNITIDACVLGPYATLLNQGADITGGIYFKPPNGSHGLLQHLLVILDWVFLPSITERGKLTLPPTEPVDYRAACFCHRQLISEGFVCSTCLSIFCKFMPICTTCNTTFKPPVLLSSIKKKSPTKH